MTVDELLAREQIRDLQARYMRGLDRLDADLLRDTFHDDADLNYGFYAGGPDAFVAMALGALGAHEANHHMLGQTLLWIDGDTASGELYFQAYHRISRDGEARDLLISGRYVDRYEKRAGEWRISARAEVNDWSRDDPASDRYFRDQPDQLRGARAPDDYSYR
ncbi:MAG: nuclear transport factor 2 family protein [Pseudomonadota bacterium]